MDTLFTAAGSATAATLLLCLVGIRYRRSRREIVRAEPTFSLDATMAHAPGMIVGAKPFLVDSDAEWQERVALGYGQEKGILAEIWDALPEGDDGDDWLRRRMDEWIEEGRRDLDRLADRSYHEFLGDPMAFLH